MAARTEPASADIALARRALALLDLTDLADNASETSAEALCRAAVAPAGKVAAICVWPQFVKLGRQHLAGSGVKVATVVNFPAGGTDEARVADDVAEAAGDGADEIDLVLPWRAFLQGRVDVARSMVEAVADSLDERLLLKVILETGAYPDQTSIAAASRLAIEAGADFIKTSTGKFAISATPEAARTMLETIRDMNVEVGLKPSGGIRTLADARIYLDLADTIMGPRWAGPTTFRFGASGLHAALVATIEGREAATPARAY